LPVLKSFDDISVFVIEKDYSRLVFRLHFSVIILKNFSLGFLPLPNTVIGRQQSLYRKEVGVSMLIFTGVFQPAM